MISLFRNKGHDYIQNKIIVIICIVLLLSQSEFSEKPFIVVLSHIIGFYLLAKMITESGPRTMMMVNNICQFCFSFCGRVWKFIFEYISFISY